MSRFGGARLAAVAVVVLAALAALFPAYALADGDPASDVLLGENVFYPYQPATSPALQRTLNDATAAAKKAGFPIKVALIGSPVDLGVIPDLFGHPQQYANFLDQEISFEGKQPLLVVMAAGYGVQGMSAKAIQAAAALPKPAGRTSDALAGAAITAVGKLAAAAGHPVSGVPGVSSGSSSSSSTTVVLVILIAAALATAGALIVVRRRQGPGRRQAASPR